MDPTSAALRHASMLSPHYRAIGKAPRAGGYHRSDFVRWDEAVSFCCIWFLPESGRADLDLPMPFNAQKSKRNGHVCVSAGERSEGGGVAAWSSRQPEIVTCGPPVKGR
jgi:hypothetical protein